MKRIKREMDSREFLSEMTGKHIDEINLVTDWELVEDEPMSPLELKFFASLGCLICALTAYHGYQTLIA